MSDGHHQGATCLHIPVTKVTRPTGKLHWRVTLVCLRRRPNIPGAKYARGTVTSQVFNISISSTSVYMKTSVNSVLQARLELARRGADKTLIWLCALEHLGVNYSGSHRDSKYIGSASIIRRRMRQTALSPRCEQLTSAEVNISTFNPYFSLQKYCMT